MRTGDLTPASDSVGNVGTAATAYASGVFDNISTGAISISGSGGGVIPSGGIIMWKGTVATIPSGWVLCNGSNGTPDLRDRFIVGATQDDLGVAKTNVTGSLTQSGGASTGTTATTGPSATVQVGTGGAPSYFVGTQTHTHNVTLSAIIPPYYALCYIMKT